MNDRLATEIEPQRREERKETLQRNISANFASSRFPCRCLTVVYMLILVGALSSCRSARPRYEPVGPPPSVGEEERGIASWYGEPYHGRKTASGETYNMHDLTAAHRTLPFGTQVRVTRTDTRAQVEVRINDRGPFIQGRIIDLSYEAARRIGLDVDGVAPVSVLIIGRTNVRSESPSVVDERTEVAECFWVQVGAFGDLKNAERAVVRLKNAGERALKIEGPQGLNRVRVGPFSQQSEAEQARDRLLPDWPVAKVVECGG